MEMSIGDLWVEPDVVCVRITRPKLTIPILREQFELMRGLAARTPIQPVPLMLDFGELAAIDRDAREYAAALLGPRWNKAIAIVCRNAVHRVIASFFKGLNKTTVPLAITADSREARSMLRRMESGLEPLWNGGQASDKLDQIVSAVSRMAAGDFDINIRASDDCDELDAVACGIAMLAEETASLIKYRRQAEAELTTVNRRLQEELAERRRMASDLQLINGELDGFAHTVTHDLKGPLSAIGAASRLILHMRSMPYSAEVESNMEEVLWLVVKNVDRADSLIEDTLALAEAGQQPNVVCRVDISSVVGRVLEERSEEIKEKAIIMRVDEDLGGVVANPTQMYQVFANLIGNAIKHNDNERPEVEIRRTNWGGGGARFTVRDNGPGIPDDELERIFTPFFKGKTGSTGIGLSIVARIVSVYDGDITVANDGGARFDLTLKDYGSA